jgi:hypothetical protein
MANLDAPFGLYPVVHPGGTPRIRRYWAASGAAAIGQGCLVQSDGGVIAVANSGSSFILGVSSRFVTSAKPTDKSPGFHDNTAGSKLKAVDIYDDPKQVFACQYSSSNTDERSFLGAYFSLLNASTFNATTLQSKGEVHGTPSYLAPLAANDRPVLCVGIRDQIGRGAANLTNPVLLVMFSEAHHILSKHGSLT